MHHMYPVGKGDPLCPLGFHPQVRWPTRCKRCFRDYKEHSSRKEESLRKDEMTMSTPSLTSWSSPSSRQRDEIRSSSTSSTSSNSSSGDSGVSSSSSSEPKSTTVARFSTNRSLSASWTSTPDLGKLSDDTPTVSITLPRKRPTVTEPKSSLDAAARSTEFTVRRRTSSDLSKLLDSPPTLRSRSHTTALPDLSSSQSAEKVEKKTVPSVTSATAVIRAKNNTDSSKTISPTKTTSLVTKKPVELKKTASTNTLAARPRIKKIEEKTLCEDSTNPEVEFILKVKSSKIKERDKKTSQVVRQSSSILIPPHSSSSSSGTDDSVEDDDDAASTTATETTETTLVDRNDNELQEQIDSLKSELDTMKARCERVEREKSDILLRRLASLDTSSSKTAASEVLKLQQKVNELSTLAEDLKDDKKSLSLKVRELEQDLETQKNSGKSSKRAEELQAKLAAAETLCEELMDENEEMKKELRELEEEIEEMQDNFREDQVDEYSSLKKELEQTTKNCRILSFKLRKVERKAEQLESEKLEAEKKFKEVAGGQVGLDHLKKIEKLEADLKVANEVAARLTKELEEAKVKNDGKTKGSFGSNAKTPSQEKVSRASLTRGGSQDDSTQLLRDLHDSMEREADLREQLRFAEEEAANLRKKAIRVEEDNESLALQLKKMATKAKTGRRLSPTPNRLTPEPIIEKDEGISEEDDPAELKLMLELNEQEAAVLRRKVEELETESEQNKRKIKELEDKVLLEKKSTITNSYGNVNVTPLDKQKMKVLEDEAAELRKKLIEKERDVERLQSEVQLAQKRSKGSLVKSKSLDSGNEQQAVDLKRQIQLVEQEVTVLRSKVQTLESENEKLTTENKKLQLLRGARKTPVRESDSSQLEAKVAEFEKKIKELEEKLEAANKKSTVGGLSKTNNVELDKLKKDMKTKTDELDKLTKENKELNESLRRLRDDATSNIIEYYKKRTPKKVTDLSTKLQMKKMVDDLEIEIGEILFALKKSETDKANQKDSGFENVEKLKELENQLQVEENLKKELGVKVKKVTDEKDKIEKQLKEEKEKLEKKENERKKVEGDLKKLEKEKEELKTSKNDLENQIKKLNLEKKTSALQQDEMAVLMKKIDNLNKEVEVEKENSKQLQSKLESINKIEEEKNKLTKELTEKNKHIVDQDKKLKECDQKLKLTEKNLATSKSKVTKLEKTIEDEEKIKKERDERYRELQRDLEGKEAKNKSLILQIKDLEYDVKARSDKIKSLEEEVRKERERATDASVKAGSAEKREITSLREEVTKTKKHLEDANAKLEKLEKVSANAEEKCKSAEKEKEIMESKLSDLDLDLQAERKKIERMKTAHEKELRNRETELAALKVKIRSLEHSTGTSTKKVTELKDEFTTRIHSLESDLSASRQEYEDLTVKYELLEEEHVVTKAQLVMEKESLQSQIVSLKRQLDDVLKEIETYKTKQEQWIKDKLDLQELIKETEEKMGRAAESKWDLEKNRMVAINEEQASILEQVKQQNESILHQMEFMRKENEDLRKKLDDFDKVSKHQRQMSADSEHLDRDLRESRAKLTAEEKNHKSEMAALKLRYESRVNLISEELQSSQSQISRFKRERDTFRHMLEEAQSQMAQLKSKNRDSTASPEEIEDNKTALATLEQQISCMEDELSEARLEASKLKTELVSGKSAWEVKISELQSRVNELEEEKILASGRTKIPGLRTRMELAWQKERDDKERLLQETSTLARDLRQTLFEVERERDKERLEAKRRQDQVKKASEEEMEENRKKITELQCDLLELRDAHAKLRTTNEKLRREKDRFERENRSQQRGKPKSDEEDRKLRALLDYIDTLMKILPEVFERRSLPPTGKPKVPKSREPSPMVEDDSVQLQIVLQRLNEAAEDIRSKLNGDNSDDRSRRSVSMGPNRRAGSTESDITPDVNSKKTVVTKKPSLFRKSLSLSETAGPMAQDQNIWKDSEDGSLTSLDEHVNNRLLNIGRREASMDSRLSGGSTQSEITGGEKKKKKGIFGKLTQKLSKTRSFDDEKGSQEDFTSQSVGGSGSDISTVGDELKGSKKDLKDRLSGMFKKGSSSRSNSQERGGDEKDSNSKTLPRNKSSSARSDTSQSSSLGRPLKKSS